MKVRITHLSRKEYKTTTCRLLPMVIVAMLLCLPVSLMAQAQLGAGISGTAGICPGSQTTLTIQATGGTLPYKVYYHFNGELTGSVMASNTLELTVNEDATCSLYAIVDANKDSVAITGQTATVQVWHVAPRIFSSANTFLQSVCSVNYINAPFNLTLDKTYATTEWFFFTTNGYSSVGVGNSYKVTTPGNYLVKVTDEHGCEGADSIQFNTITPLDTRGANGMICNGKFENISFMDVSPQHICHGQTITSCDGASVEGGPVDTRFYGFEFETDNRYAYKFREGLPNTFVVNDSLVITGHNGEDRLIYPALSDSNVNHFGGYGNLFFMKGKVGNASCDGTGHCEWRQTVTLQPNTNYELSFKVASIGDPRSNKINPPIITFGFDNAGAYIPLIGNPYYLNDESITRTLTRVDSSIVLTPIQFGDTIDYIRTVRYSASSSDSSITTPLELTISQTYGFQAWYEVKCLFNSRELSSTKLVIRNTGENATYNIVALDSILLKDGNRKPFGGGSRRVLVGREWVTPYNLEERDLHDTVSVANIKLPLVDNFSYTQQQINPLKITDTYTWKPTRMELATIDVEASDNHGLTETLKYYIQACWDYDLVIDNVVQQVNGVTVNNLLGEGGSGLYAGSDTIHIQCQVRNDYLYDDTKKHTIVPSNFLITLTPKGAGSPLTIMSKAVRVLNPTKQGNGTDTVGVDVSFICPKSVLNNGVYDHNLNLIVDRPDMVRCENNEGNNTISIPVKFKRLFADLVVENASVSNTNLLPGETEFTYSFDVSNKGTIPRLNNSAEAVTVKAYIAGDNGQKRLLRGDTILTPVVGKAPLPFSQTLTLPADIFYSKNYHFQFVVDEEVVAEAETDPANNAVNITTKVLDFIEFQGLQDSYTFPATDSLKIDFKVIDNNTKGRLTVGLGSGSDDIVSLGAAFIKNDNENVSSCGIHWLPSYQHIGTYKIIIGASDQFTHQTSREITLKITDTPPVIDSLGQHPDTIGVMIPLRFRIRATDRTTGDSISFRVEGKAASEFGASVIQTAFGNQAAGWFEWIPDYNAGGLYPITVYATDKGGLYDSVSFNVVVKALPNASFTYVSQCDSNKVLFKTAGDGATYTWSFGDGTSQVSRLSRLVHYYKSPGKYQVTLRAHKDGADNSTAEYVLVGTPKAFFASRDVCFGEITSFSNVTEGASAYEWDFGDGTPKSNVINAVHRYAPPKDTIFQCKLTVSVGGCSDSYTQPIHVAAGVKASIVASDSGRMICEGTEVRFDGSGSKGALAYYWDFKDTASNRRNRSKDMTVSHLFTRAGSYQVSLTVNNGMCQDKVSYYVTVEPVPQLYIDGPQYVCAGNNAVLTGRIKNASQSNFFEYRWLDEQDSIMGSNKTIRVNHQGTYKLLTSNSCGSSDTAKFTLSELNAPQAEVNLVSGVTCTGVADGVAKLSINRQNTIEAPYNVAWNDSSKSASDTALILSHLKEGPNYITITNALGCKSSLRVEVPNAGPSLGVTTTPSGCKDSSGVMKVTIQGYAETEPFNTIRWAGTDDGEATANSNQFNITNLAKGRYNLTVINKQGCEMRANNILISSPSVSIMVPIKESCGSEATRVTIDASLSGDDEATPEFTYAWYVLDSVHTLKLLPQTDTSAALDAGEYMVKVADGKSLCADSAFFFIEKGVALTAKITGSEPLCFGDSTGKLRVRVTGNSGDIHYQWTTREDTTEILSTSPEFINVKAGAYTVLVSDSRACTAIDTITLFEPEEIIVSDFQGSLCSATVNISPKGQYTYSWIRLDSINGELAENTVKTTPDTFATALPQGLYYVQAQSSGGCTGKTETIGEIEGRTTPRTFGIHYSFVNPNQEPEEVKETPTDNTTVSIIADMKVSILAGVTKCRGTIEGNAQEVFEEQCFNETNLNDAMTLEYTIPYYHYTLYYYDRANNLTKTVPPEGVKLLSNEEIAAIKLFRATGVGNTPATKHTLQTTYDYSALNQMVGQTTPDAGASRFIYDNKERLRFSQTAQQATEGKYSYTKYDNLTRPIEVGQASIGNFETLKSLADSASYPKEGCKDITVTRYTTPASDVSYYGAAQRYLNNRVSYTFTDEDGDSATLNDRTSSYYSYDSHGNVEWLIQDIPGLGKNYIRYTYDLISNKVLEVAFNENRGDKFFHRYNYDEDNRLLSVSTSTDGILWDNDARYNYYAHGPLRRTELGEDKIQGIDYTYTIEGWLKAVNHPSLSPSDDPAADGAQNSSYLKDVFGMTLGYYQGDFNRKRKNNGPNPFANTNDFSAAANLYNGNISSWTVQTQSASSGSFSDKMTSQVFAYDKLNRIKSSDFYYNDGGWNATRFFGTSYEYDKNGNILALKRYGNKDEIKAIDDLTYQYEAGTNKLSTLKDLSDIADNGEYGDLVSDGATKISHQYTYDKIGNLTGDEGYEKTLVSGDTYKLYNVKSSIAWNIAGKIKQVQLLRKPVDSIAYDTTTIVYTYGSDGNRVKKDVFRHNLLPENRTTTFYVRDATGNIMGIYNRSNNKIASNPGSYKAVFTLSEEPIYGSSRLGVRTGGDTLYTTEFTGEGNGIEVVTKPLEGKAGLKNWITPAMATVNLDANNKLCNCQVRNVNFTSGAFSSTGDAATFMGFAKNNVAIAEDFEGKLLFYSVVADDYFGNKDVCLIFDAKGRLMKNSSGINSAAKAKPMVVKAQGETNKYYLITVGIDHKPYYHVIDMGQNGYGIGAGAVTGKNIPLDNTSGLNYGYHMSVIEDNAQRKSLVYMTRYNPPAASGVEGQTDVVVFDFEPNASSSPLPQVLTSIPGYDKYGEGELQLSPAGNRLAYYNRKRGIAGFAHQEVELHVFGLGKERKTVETRDTLSISGSTAGTAGKASVEFTSDEKVLLFSQDGLYLNDATGSQQSIWSYRFDSKELSMLRIPVSGDIRRGVDGNIYVAPKNMNNRLYRIDNLLTEPTVDTSTYRLFENEPGYYSMGGGLPQQSFRIAPVSEGLYSRMLGEKQYELTDHLGNVRATVSDAREASFDINGNLINTPSILSSNDYYPFGMLMPGRTFNTPNYRYGFNGKEKDNDMFGLNATTYDYGFRIYDSRVVKFLSVDPLTKDYPSWSPYPFAMNRPIDGFDLDGLEYKATKDKDGNYTGFTWDPENAYDDKGKLKSDYYEKAILFSQNSTKTFTTGTWQNDKQRYSSFNMGTATATVYTYTTTTNEDGTTTKTPASSTYDATTLPADPNHFNTVASGLYMAKFGKHPISDGYPALNVYTLGDSRNLPTPAGGTITGVNIHKAGLSNYTGTLWKQKDYYFETRGGVKKVSLSDQRNKYGGVSEGCFTIDINNWSSFIGNFGAGDNNIGVILQQASFSGSQTTKPKLNPDVQKYNDYKRREFMELKRQENYRIGY